MSTARDLVMIAMDREPSGPLERGDLSLALAGGELADLLRLEAVHLDDEDRLVPGYRPTLDDGLLDDAAASLQGPPPYTGLDDWLWTRGRDLLAAYLRAFEAEGLLTRHRQRRLVVFRTSELVLADSAARHRAADRWAADDPLLVALAAAAGLDGERAGEREGEAAGVDDAVAKVVAAVGTAVEELAVERERRAHKLDDATAANIRRGY